MSIMQRLVYSLIVTVITLLVIGGGGLLQLNQAHDRFVYVQENTLPSLQLAQAAKAELSEQRIVLHKAMLEQDPGKLSELEKTSRTAADARKVALSAYEKDLVSDDTDRKNVTDALTASQTYTVLSE